MLDRDSAEFRPARESSPWIFPALVVVALLAAGGWWYWSQHRPLPAAAAPPTASAPQPDAPPAPAAAAPTGPQNPVDALAAPDTALPGLNDADAKVAAALTELLGKKPVASFLQIDGFARRFVATVDNLPRAQAPSRMWPVQPAPQRFAVQGAEGGPQTIEAVNASRYGAFVSFAESIDTARAVAVYARLYPLFQQAYEELGYPGRYFNDRLVAVLDHLLQTPEPTGPLQVQLIEVKGDVHSERPWVRYEFVDSQLQSLSAGQKMLVRMGPDNERRLKAKLADLRRQVATGAMAAKK